MKKNEGALQTIAYLSNRSTLDVDTNQSNRYCILLNQDHGKIAYYFSTPIYNCHTNSLVKKMFRDVDKKFSFIGSCATIWVDNSHIEITNLKSKMIISFPKNYKFILENGSLHSTQLDIFPTWNGIMIFGNTSEIHYQIQTKFHYSKIRKSKNCIAFMESQFKPAFVISALYSQMSDNVCYPANIIMEERESSLYDLKLHQSHSLGERTALEINCYEPKLFQDTPVSGKVQGENNAFGASAFIGESELFGTQWLYSRPDFGKIPLLRSKIISDISLYIPKYVSKNIPIGIFKIANRFCSFGSTWKNKVQRSDFVTPCMENEKYYIANLNDFLLQNNQIMESPGFVITPLQKKQNEFASIATGDNYTTPQILCVKYTDA